VIACTEVCRSLVVFPGMPDDDGFSRRFFGAPPDHTRWTVLQSPVIGPVEEKDDLRHVENHAALLVNQCYGPPKRQLDTSVRADLRKRLARDDVTWHEVWGSVIKEFDRLQA